MALKAAWLWSCGRSREPSCEPWEREGMPVPTLAQAWGEMEAGGFLRYGNNTWGTWETLYDSPVALFVSAEELSHMSIHNVTSMG